MNAWSLVTSLNRPQRNTFLTAMNSLSHGTQDAYPTFLQKQLGYGPAVTSALTIVANVGAICGGTLFGYFSQYLGRRRAIIVAAVLGIIMIPLWSGLVRFPGAIALSLAIGAFLLQFMVQGAWGIIPAHLNELSPGDVRATFPGFAYQFGNLLAAFIVTAEALVAEGLATAKHPNYGGALAIFSFSAFVAVIFFSAIGREAKDVDFTRAAERPVESGMDREQYPAGLPQT